MSKPVFVTLPCLLLLLDYWPLSRWGGKSATLTLFKEKIPFAVLALASSIITCVAQYNGGAIVDMHFAPLGLRISNAILSYWRYLAKTLYPVELAFYYPLQHANVTPLVFIALVSLLLVTATVIRYRTVLPALAFGWGWYLISLLPMIGIIQVGGQAMADRYSYLTSIGLLVCIVWGASAISQKLNLPMAVLRTSGIIAVALLTVLAWQQAARWRNGFSLYSHAYQLNPNNYMALTKTGDTLIQDKRWYEAASYYLRSLKIDRAQKDVHNNLAICLKRMGKLDQALPHLQEALRLDPNYLEAYINLALCYQEMGNFEQAKLNLLQALELAPEDSEALFSLGYILNLQRKPNEAINTFSRLLELQPNDAGAHYNLAKSYLALQRIPEAILHLQAALALVPDIADANLLLQQATQAAENHK
jgi:tetratricopeptide (TPR) repeat protein